MDPAFGAVGVSNFAPGIEFGNHLDRQVGAIEHPINRVTDPGAGSNVNFTCPQGHEPRQRQTRYSADRCRPDRGARQQCQM